MAITRYLMIGEEDEYGVEALNFPETVDPETASIDPAGDDKLIYEGMGGLDRRAGLGVYSTAGDITIPLDNLVSGWFFKWALGGYEVSGTVGSYTHIFTPQMTANMQSFSARIGKDIMEHVFLGNVVSSINIEVDSEWALMTVSTVGAKDKRAELAETVDYTEGLFYTAPMASLTQDGTDKSAEVNSLSLTIDTGADVESSQGFGSRFPTKAMRGSTLVEMELTLSFDSDEELINFWGGADGPSTTDIQEFAYTLSFGDEIDFIFPRVVYTTSGQPAEGRDGITQTLTARAMYDDVSKVGPIQISMTNDKESY